VKNPYCGSIESKGPVGDSSTSWLLFAGAGPTGPVVEVVGGEVVDVVGGDVVEVVGGEVVEVVGGADEVVVVVDDELDVET
jgi:hypothetical protein